MTQDEQWDLNYEQMMTFMETYHKRPSKHKVEEHGMLNWFKYSKKMIAKGKFSPQRVERFAKLLEVAESLQRINQFQYLKQEKNEEFAAFIPKTRSSMRTKTVKKRYSKRPQQTDNEEI